MRFASQTTVNKMADELEFDLDQLDADINNKNKIQKRITDLSEKVKSTSEERDSLAKEKQNLQIERDTLAKERDFYSKFSDASAKYPGANEFKDKILEKVKQGYDPEDATVAIMAREGKLQNTPASLAEKDTVAGGSATTALRGDGTKSLKEMTQAEKRTMLMENEGDVENIMRRGL